MTFYGKHTFEDLLDGQIFLFKDLWIDTDVNVTVARKADGSFEIDSCDFGCKEVRILYSAGDYVVLGSDNNSKFFEKLEQAIEQLALTKAVDLPLDAWQTHYNEYF